MHGSRSSMNARSDRLPSTFCSLCFASILDAVAFHAVSDCWGSYGNNETEWNRVACSWFIFGVINLPFRFHFVERLQSGSRLIAASGCDFDWRNQNRRRSPSLVRRRRQIRPFNSPWTGRIFKASRYDKNHNYHCQMEIKRWLFFIFLILSNMLKI